jgi:hypothetical protein
LSAQSDRAAPIAVLAALLLVAASVLLALPGPGLVPGAGADAPRWVLGIFGDGLGLSAGLYLALIYVAIAAWAAFCLLARAVSPRVVWGLIGALVAVFTLAPPLLSLDVFSYISYARLGVEEGLNPYESVPADIPADAAASRVDDFRFAVSVYGPLFTLVTYPLGAAGVGFALWALKALAGLSVLAIAALTAHLARLRGLAAAPAAAFVALNPLVLIHIVYAPFALAGSDRRLRLAAGLAAAALVIGAVTLAAFGGSAAEALGVAGDNQATVSRWSVPGTLSRITGIDVDPIRIAFAVLYGGAVLALLAWVLRGADWVRAAGWATFGLLVATAWMVPWYVIWLLPLAAIARDRPLLLAAVALTVFQAINAVPV